MLVYYQENKIVSVEFYPLITWIHGYLEVKLLLPSTSM